MACLFISCKLNFLPSLFLSTVASPPLMGVVIHGKRNYLDHVKRLPSDRRVPIRMIGVQVHGTLQRAIEIAFNL